MKCIGMHLGGVAFFKDREYPGAAHQAWAEHAIQLLFGLQSGLRLFFMPVLRWS